MQSTFKESWLYLLIILNAIIVFLLSFYIDMEGYYLFIVLGIIIFILSESLGKEIYFIIPIIIISIGAELIGYILIVDYFNVSGLNPLKVHPLTITWLTIYCIEIIRKIYKENKINIDKYMVISYSFIFLYGFITIILRGLRGMPILFECYIGPITFFLFIKDSKLNFKSLERIFLVFLCYGVFLTMLGIMEYFLMYNPLDTIYSKANWLTDTKYEGYRIKTLLGNPLVNATFFLFCIIVTQIYIKHIFKYILMALFFIAIILTGSRSFMVFALVALLYNRNFLISFKAKEYKYIFASIVTAIFGLFLMILTPIGNTILTRFYMASDSVQVRIIVIKYFFENFTNFSLHGLGSSATDLILYNSRHEPIIIEIPWIVLFFEIGHFIWLYILFLGKVIINIISHKYLILVFILALSTYISFGTKMPINYLLYILISISAIRINEEKEGRDYEKACPNSGS